MKETQRIAEKDIKKAGVSVKPPEEEIAEEAVIEASTETPVEKEPIQGVVPAPGQEIEKEEIEKEEIKEERKEETLQPFKLKLPKIDLSGAKKILLKE